MRRADAVGASVSAADDEHILPLCRNALLLGELHSGEHTVLLGEQFQCEVNAFEVASGDIQVASRRCSRAYHVGIELTLRQFAV